MTTTSCICGAPSTALVEIIDVDGTTVLDSHELCDMHTDELTARLIATYSDGSPAYRVDRHPGVLL